jgi:hypothetical protein
MRHCANKIGHSATPSLIVIRPDFIKVPGQRLNEYFFPGIRREPGKHLKGRVIEDRGALGNPFWLGNPC